MNTCMFHRRALSALRRSLLIALLFLTLTGCGRNTEPVPADPQPEPPQTSEPSAVPEQEPDEDVSVPVSPPVEQTPDLPPKDIPPVVPAKPVSNKNAPAKVRFPCTIPGYDLVIERIAPYSGLYLEDGSNAEISQVAMLLIRNDGSYPVEFAEIAVTYGETQLLFDVAALPAGERLVVQEKNAAPIPEGVPNACSVLVSRRAAMDMSTSEVSVVDNGDNSLTVRNLTDQTIPTVRVFYKYFDQQSGVFVGGIAYTAGITQLAGDSSITVYPSHFSSQSSRIVMVLTYDEINEQEPFA